MWNTRCIYSIADGYRKVQCFCVFALRPDAKREMEESISLLMQVDCADCTACRYYIVDTFALLSSAIWKSYEKYVCHLSTKNVYIYLFRPNNEVAYI